MRNPFKNPLQKRGLPDSALHGGYSQHQTDDSALVPVSAPPPVNNLAHQAAPLPGYPYNNNNSQSSETATAYPYGQQPDNQELSGAAFEVNTGYNTNKRGQQQGGNIRFGNTLPGFAPLAIPQNGRFVFNAGNNLNEGDSQVNGNIDFANVEFQHDK